MRKHFYMLIGIALIIQMSCPLYSQDYYSYYKNERVNYSAAPDKVILQLKSQEKLNEKYGLDSLMSLGLEGLFIGFYKSGNLTTETVLKNLKQNIDIKYVSPVLLNSHGEEMGALSDEIIVKLKKESNLTSFQDLLLKYGAKIVKNSEYDPLSYYISAVSFDGNTLDLANRFQASGLFEFSEPNFWLFVNPAMGKVPSTSSSNADQKYKQPQSANMLCPADPLYSQQWALNNTGQNDGVSDADIDAPEAWGITTGSASIKIAILDNGVQISHPDLNGNWVQGGDMTSGVTACQDGGSYGQPNLCTPQGDSHGTLVSGVAVAKGCSNLGITGIAHTSKIIPIRVYLGEANITNNGWIADGIYFAKNQGADIINLSLTLAGSFSAVDAAITNVITTGRGGKGCIIVAATGNNAQPGIGYPASNPSVMAVGNTTNKDLRYYESQFGIGLDVVAPGHDVYTTDLVGGKGINTTGDYVNFYGGTSLSSPLTAGVIALILSVNSNISYGAARLLLESTTDKVTPATYSYSSGVSGQPNGSWNYDMGYGRINAYKAVKATSSSNISGPNIICTSGTFTLEIIPNVTRVWTSSNTSLLTINSSTGVATKVGTSSGNVTITMTYSSSMASYAITKNIWVGTPDVSTIKYDNGIGAGTSNYVSPNTTHTVYLDQQNVINGNVSTTNWNPNPNVGYGYGTAFSQFNFNLTSGSSITFNPVSAINSCGTSNRTLAFIANSSFKIAPNPAKDVLKIIFDNVEYLDALPVQIELYSESSLKVVKSISIAQVYNEKLFVEGNVLAIDVRDLPRGIYYLRIVPNKNVDDDVKQIRVSLQ